MSDKLTKTFFDTFEIKPELDYFVSFIDDKMKIGRFFHCNKEELIYKHKHTKDKMKVLRVDLDYPQITDRILLELICILNKEIVIISKVQGNSLDKVKANILENCIRNYEFYSTTSLQTYNKLANNFKQQVQALFKENN